MSTPSEGFVRRADLVLLAMAARAVIDDADDDGVSNAVPELREAAERVDAYLETLPPLSPADPRSSAPPA